MADYTPYRGPLSRGARALLERYAGATREGREPAGDGRHRIALLNLKLLEESSGNWSCQISDRGREYLYGASHGA
jgi:hypothetical protein